jgi:murein DD-endopeptidase MepM/ murein hydrolase activator NlpD
MSPRATAILIVCALLGAAREGSAQATRFRFPLQNCHAGCSTVTAYFDRDNSSAKRDWNCEMHTYDGHRGTDIALIGGFAAQDQGRTIVAGADGTVMTTHDGEADRCTTGDCGGGGGFGNYVVLRHGDGKLSYYAHMRRGSLRVMPGQRVRCGDALGLVGSSGNSTGSHLHFEVRVSSTATDSFEGRAACGGGVSHWVSQGTYRNLPAESCATAPPTDSGVSVDAAIMDGGARDSGVAPLPDVVAVRDAVSDATALGDDSSMDGARTDAGAMSADGSARSDSSSDGGYIPNDGGGCQCRATAQGSRLTTMRLMLAAIVALAVASRRGSQSGRFEQQRKPVE